jgi:hypothetical protein
MLRDLRVKVRTRHSRISSCGFQNFLPLTKQFFDFVNNSPILKSVVVGLLARNPNSVTEAQTVLPNGSRVVGDTAEQAATIGYVKWQTFAAQNDPHAFYIDASGGMQQGLELYRDWYVEPLFDYLDEVLDDGNVVLATLTRYKNKVEWYRRSEVLALYEKDTLRGEKHLKQHMFEFLFDQGLPFHVEPTTASGKPDVVSLEDSEHPFIGEVKIFDPERNKGRSVVKEGFSQVYRYCWDYNEPLGHLIVFNVSNKQLSVELPSAPDGIPRFELNHKTIFLTVIDAHEHGGTASTRGIAETVTITAAELVREIEEATKVKS